MLIFAFLLLDFFWNFIALLLFIMVCEWEICGWQERIVQLFEKNTYSVVNIFDVTLRPQLNVTGMVEVIGNKIMVNVVLATLTHYELAYPKLFIVFLFW